MRLSFKTLSAASTALLAAGTTASAGEGFPASDFIPGGWGVFFTEISRSVDVVDFALLTMLAVLLGMCVDLLVHLRTNKLIPDSLLGEVQEEMANGEYEKALEVCEKSDCLIGQIFAAALSKTDYSFERMEEAMRSESRIQGLVWRQWVGQFRTAAICSLMLGGMGACVNAMRFFSDLTGRPNLGLALASSFEMRALIYNIFSALFIGCLMALVSLIVYGVCSSKLEKLLVEAERLGGELLDPFRPLPIPLEE